MRRSSAPAWTRRPTRGGKPVACAIPGTCAGIKARRLRSARIAASWATIRRRRSGSRDHGRACSRHGRHDALFAHGLAMQAAPCCWKARCWTPRRRNRRKWSRGGAGRRAAAARQGLGLHEKDADIVKPWTRRGGRCPGGAPYHPAGFMTFVGAYGDDPRQDQGRLPGGQGAAQRRLRGRIGDFDTALKIGGAWLLSILLKTRRRRHDPLAVPEPGGAGEGRQPPGPSRTRRFEELGHHWGRRHDGRGIAMSRPTRHRGGAESCRSQGRRRTPARAHADACSTQGVKRATVDGRGRKADGFWGRLTATTGLCRAGRLRLILEAVFLRHGHQGRVDEERAEGPALTAFFATNTRPLADHGRWPRHVGQAEQFIGIHSSAPSKDAACDGDHQGQSRPRPGVAQGAYDFVRLIRKTRSSRNRCAGSSTPTAASIPYINEGIR